MCRLLKNEMSKKNVVSRRRIACFFVHSVLSGGARPEAWQRLPRPRPPVLSEQGVLRRRDGTFWQNQLFRVDETPTFELVGSCWLGSLLLCPLVRCVSARGLARRPSAIGFSQVGVLCRRNDTFPRKVSFGVAETTPFEMQRHYTNRQQQKNMHFARTRRDFFCLG